MTKAERTRRSRVRKLLEILPSRGEKAFPTFVNALVESHQDDLAKLLDNNLFDEFKKRCQEEESQIYIDCIDHELDQNDMSTEEMVVAISK